MIVNIICLLLGIDAAGEELNLQQLESLINLDFVWNPTRLEQREGRIQRFDNMHIFNLRYKDSAGALFIIYLLIVLKISLLCLGNYRCV